MHEMMKCCCVFIKALYLLFSLQDLSFNKLVVICEIHIIKKFMLVVCAVFAKLGILKLNAIFVFSTSASSTVCALMLFPVVGALRVCLKSMMQHTGAWQVWLCRRAVVAATADIIEFSTYVGIEIQILGWRASSRTWRQWLVGRCLWLGT